jgi:hypothetical protein
MIRENLKLKPAYLFEKIPGNIFTKRALTIITFSKVKTKLA